jgi:hypothetical protein
MGGGGGLLSQFALRDFLREAHKWLLAGVRALCMSEPEVRVPFLIKLTHFAC